MILEETRYCRIPLGPSPSRETKALNKYLYCPRSAACAGRPARSKECKSLPVIDGVCEHLVDGGIARLDPSDVAALMHPQREFERL